MTENVLLLTVIAHNNIELHLVYVEKTQSMLILLFAKYAF